MKTHPKIAELVNRLSATMADEGRLVDVGWSAYRVVMHDGLTPYDEQALRYAFFGGAQHLFASLLGILEEGKDATRTDLKRVVLVHQELIAFGKELEGYVALHRTKTEGNA